jgi:hypothetical protein
LPPDPVIGTATSSEVSPGYWGYLALDWLSRHNIIKDYPVGFFSGQRWLRAYEFAQAVRRAKDSLDAVGQDEFAGLLVEALADDFSHLLDEV